MEEAQPLRRGKAVLGLVVLWVFYGKELAEHPDHVQQQDDHAADAGELVLPEPPPHQLPLRGDERPVLFAGPQIDVLRLLRGSVARQGRVCIRHVYLLP